MGNEIRYIIAIYTTLKIYLKISEFYTYCAPTGSNALKIWHTSWGGDQMRVKYVMVGGRWLILIVDCSCGQHVHNSWTTLLYAHN